MHWPSFFSWKIETVLFFLAEKEKNGVKKLGGQGRPPLQGAGAFMKYSIAYRCGFLQSPA